MSSRQRPGKRVGIDIAAVEGRLERIVDHLDTIRTYHEEGVYTAEDVTSRLGPVVDDLRKVVQAVAGSSGEAARPTRAPKRAD